MKILLLLPAIFLVNFQAQARPLLPERKIEVQGHRGARALRPENTLAAFDYALKVGVDILELDTVVTKDNRLVVIHDLFIDEKICLDSNGNKITKKISVRSLTLKEVKGFDCGSLKNPNFPKQLPAPKEKIPTLEEVFSLVKTSQHRGAKRVHLNIETKIVPGLKDLSPSPKEFAMLLVEVIRNSRMIKRSIVQSFDHRTLKAVKRLEPSIRISPLISNSMPDLTALAKNLGAEIVSPNLGWISVSELKTLHQAGVEVHAWTANTVEEWAYLVDLGVDGIITDDPEALIAYLKKNKLR